MIEPGQLYRDLDARCDGRSLEVVSIVRAPQETRVVCISRGKVTLIDLDRMIDPSRFQKWA